MIDPAAYTIPAIWTIEVLRAADRKGDMSGGAGVEVTDRARRAGHRIDLLEPAGGRLPPCRYGTGVSLPIQAHGLSFP